MYVSIDIETTGLDPETCQILEFGAVIALPPDDPRPNPEFQCYFDHEIISGEPYALAMNKSIIENIANGGGYATDYKYFIHKFLNFLGSYKVKDGFSIAGKNFANFDNLFLRKIPGWKKSIKHDHRILDPGPLYWRPEIDGFRLPGLKKCMERAGIDDIVPHNAIDDAKIVIQLIDKFAYAN